MRIRRKNLSSRKLIVTNQSIIPKESALCKDFVTLFKQMVWWRLFDKQLALIHIANENISSPGYRRHLVAMGLMAGVLDYMILYPGGIAFIEFKRDAKCKLTKHQLKFIELLKSLNIKYLVTHCVDEAIRFCENL